VWTVKEVSKDPSHLILGYQLAQNVNVLEMFGPEDEGTMIPEELYFVLHTVILQSLCYFCVSHLLG
jgi:hypothetical protein